MKRYPAFDPPEYVSWSADPELVAAFAETPRRDPERRRIVEALDEAELLGLYAGMVRTRLQDITLKRWVRTGVISKAWLGTGEEAMTVGPVHALDRSRDIVVPMIRNAGACAEMGMPIADNFRTYLGTGDSPSGGRDLHAGSLEHRVLQPISHVGDVVPVVAGMALVSRIRDEGFVVLTWIGDGSTKTGTAHEGLNFAAVQRVPGIFVIHNNQVALGTRLGQHHLAEDFSELPEAYGMAGAVLPDGDYHFPGGDFDIIRAGIKTPIRSEDQKNQSLKFGTVSGSLVVGEDGLVYQMEDRAEIKLIYELKPNL
jgi:TPP-dependent pyruvate/acetoin dehydrogenase alpha subunit